MSLIKPFTLNVSSEVIEFIRQRVSTYPWHEMPCDGGWEYGTNIDYMKDLCQYWIEDFDWRKQEKQINQFNNFKTKVDNIDVHFIHEKGSGPNPRPLIISHGWPGSITEFLHIIEPLAHPERFGGNVEDAFDVVAPSLIGYGFSGKPPRPYGPRKMAQIFNTLMTERLGYKSYIAQGGDWGGAVSTWLGFDYPESCSGIHINIMPMRHPDGPKGQEEKAWALSFEQDQISQNGYRTQQGTKPQTLSYAMMDSPVGIAAWLIEKFNSWSDVANNDIESAHSKDTLLTNIMIYIITRTFNTASWIYYAREEEGGRIMSPEGKRVEVPVGCALFPAEMSSWPPRSYVERVYNVAHWTEMHRGGHFAAMEEPDSLIEDIRKFSSMLE
tara:strand:- start:1939 stop:3087 length:1149 start_codon:yes stop_codon:yes gene_type:complete